MQMAVKGQHSYKTSIKLPSRPCAALCRKSFGERGGACGHPSWISLTSPPPAPAHALFTFQKALLVMG